jgi:hypothetical protein
VFERVGTAGQSNYDVRKKARRSAQRDFPQKNRSRNDGQELLPVCPKTGRYQTLRNEGTLSGALFVFGRRDRGRPKTLYWDLLCAWVLSKRLEKANSHGPSIGDLIEDSAFLGNETELADAISGIVADIKDEYGNATLAEAIELMGPAFKR